MPLGPYEPPQEGPKIGKHLDANELPDHKQASIGNFEEELQKRGLEEPAPPPIEPPPLSNEDEERVQRGAETLEALRRVHAQEQEGAEELFDPVEKMAEPTEEDKREFMRCILGNRQYSKTFELFGGTVTVSLGDLTPKQEEELYLELTRAQLEPGDDWAVTLDRLRLLAYSRGFDFGVPGLTGGVPTTVAGTTALIENLPSAAYYSVLMHISRVFRRHMEIMMERALDSDFWIVDGPNSPLVPLPEDPSTTETSGDTEAGK